MDLKKRLKQEAGYMKRGATIITKKVAKTVAEKSRAWWETQKEIGRQQRLAELKLKTRKRKGAKKQASNNYNDIIDILLGSDKDED